MILGTFQPLHPDPARHSARYACFERFLGYYPVFCFPARSAMEAAWGAFLAAPYWPERLVLFDSEDYRRFDLVRWNQLLGSVEDPDVAPLFGEVDELRAEYVVPEISDIIVEIPIHEALFETAYDERLEGSPGGDDDEYGLIGSLAESARSMVESQDWGKESTRFRLVAEKEALTFFLVKPIWCAATQGTVPVADICPLIPLAANDTPRRLWVRCEELLARCFDIVGACTPEGFAELCSDMSRLQSMNEAAWMEPLARALGVGRNDPCPCGSGRKYKSCHMRPRVELRER